MMTVEVGLGLISLEYHPTMIHLSGMYLQRREKHLLLNVQWLFEDILPQYLSYRR